MGCVPRRALNLAPHLIRVERSRHPRPDFCAQLPAFSDAPSCNTAFEICGQETASCEYQVDAETAVEGEVNQDALGLC